MSMPGYRLVVKYMKINYHQVLIKVNSFPQFNSPTGPVT